MTDFYSPEDMKSHGEMLSNRVRKNLKHRRKLFKKQDTSAFRLYDWDIPEIRAVVDWYDGHLVVGEYVRDQTKDIPWLETVSQILAESLDIPMDKVFLKKRQTRPGTWDRRYERLERKDHQFPVKEHGLSFLVNLEDYLDTGLFLDHRTTRKMVMDQAAGKKLLNLFSYTGSFSVYGAKGGASETCTVDLSPKYIDWAKKNFEANNITDGSHQFVVSEVFKFLDDAAEEGKIWDIIILDPPSFSTRKNEFEFDIQRDQLKLLRKTLQLLAPSGKLYFSTNHQRFSPEFFSLDVSWSEITKNTLPLDFKGKTPHRCFVFEG